MTTNTDRQTDGENTITHRAVHINCIIDKIDKPLVITVYVRARLFVQLGKRKVRVVSFELRNSELYAT